MDGSSGRKRFSKGSENWHQTVDFDLLQLCKGNFCFIIKVNCVHALIIFHLFQTLKGHSSPVLKFSFFGIGAQLLSANIDGVLKIWNMATRVCTHTSTQISEKHDGVWALSIKEDESLVACGGPNAHLTILTILEDGLSALDDSGVNITSISNGNSSLADFNPNNKPTPEKTRKNGGDADELPLQKISSLNKLVCYC